MKSWTEALVLSKIRQLLRRLSMYMPANRLAKVAARRAYRGPGRHQKFEYRCAHCGHWFPEKEIRVDHIEPAGSLRTLDDLPEFTRRLLLCGPGALQLLCQRHHQEKTNQENAARRAQRKAKAI